MANSYTQLGFVKQADGENIGSWGDVLNEQLIDLLDDAIGGYVEVSVASGNVTLAFADGTADNNGRHAVVKFTGSPGTTRTVTFPNKQKTYYINNGSDGSVICTAGAGAATVTILAGNKDIIYIDGSDEIHSVLTRTSVVLGTNTSGNILVADGNQFNSKALGDLSEISSVASDDVLMAVDTSGGGLKKITRANLVSGLAAGTMSNVVDDTSPQLGGDLDMNGQDIVTTSNANIDLLPNGTGKVIMDGNGSSGGVSVSDGLIDIRTGTGSVAKVKFYCESSNAHAQTLQAAPHSAGSSAVLTLPTATGTLIGSGDSGTVSNAMLAGSIADSKLSTISTAGKVDIGALEIDGATDIGADLADADLIIVDDGANGTERKAAMSRVQTYIEGKISGDITISSGTAAIGSGVIVNADINASAAIADSKLATITTANKVGLAALDIDGGSDIGADLTTSDLIIVDDGAGGTNRKAALSRVVTLMSAQGFSQEDPTALAIALG